MFYTPTDHNHDIDWLTERLVDHITVCACIEEELE